MSYPLVLILIIESGGRCVCVCVCVGGGGHTFLSYGQIFRFSHEEFNLVP